VAETPAQDAAPRSNDGTTPANGGANGGNGDGQTVAVSGDTPAQDGETLANSGSNAALTRRIDQLEGIVTGGFLQRLQSQLEAMPTRDELQQRDELHTQAVTAALRPLLEEMAARDERHAVEAAAAQERHAQELAAIARQLEELTAPKSKRGLLARWFGE
jgi:uncharacterized membrane protein YccC